MKIIQCSLLALAIFLSCNASRTIKSSLAQDRVETMEYKNFKNERVEDSEGIAIIRKSFQGGKLTRVQFFDINDEPLKNKKSWEKKNAEWRFAYDEQGNFVKQIAYDDAGEICRVENWSNSAIEIFKYNSKNQLEEKANYNKSMELVGLGDIGDAVTQYGYNKKGQLIWKKKLDANRKFITNGYCYSKFEYHSDGSLKKQIYLYDEDKINTYSTFTYEGGKLTKEETFDANDKKMGYKHYEYDKNGTLIKVEDWYYKWEEPSVKEDQIVLQLEGWSIPQSDLEKFDWGNIGKGEYTISINEKGEIQNIEPHEYKGGTAAFNEQVYANFRNVVLQKNAKPEDGKLNGQLKIVIPFQEIGLLNDLRSILKPDPENNY